MEWRNLIVDVSGGIQTRHLLSTIPTSYYLCQLALRCMTLGSRHNLKAGGNRDNFQVLLKYSPGGTVKDYRNPQSGHQVPKTFWNNTHNILDTHKDMSKVPLLRSTELRATGLPATWNTSQAIEGFHTVDWLCEVYRRQSYCRRSSLFARDSRTKQLHVSFPTGDSLHSDSKHIHVSRHNEFVNGVVFSLNFNLNN
jgi:hypothetical protein